jgi:uncharacterized protein YjbI with pentapeptide repeats
MDYSDFSGENLRYANFSDAYLQGANLRGANLIYADLQGANLQGLMIFSVHILSK